MNLDQAADDLATMGREAQLEPGECLWREGDPGDEVAVLLEGALEVVHFGPSGAAMLVRKISPVAVLGEIACIDGQTRSASVRAVGTSRVSRIPGKAFRLFLKRRPDVVEDLFWQQLERVRNLTREVTQTYERAITDPLTGLYNVGFFRERLALEIDRARLTGDPLAIVMLDFDHFKRFNDTHGHEAGNAALIQVTRIFVGHGRRGDIVARYGGEEFVALLYGANREEAYQFAEKLRGAVEEATILGGDGKALGKVTLSGGIGAFPEDVGGVERSNAGAVLIEAADACLYRAKQAGRNRIVAVPLGTGDP